LTLLIGFVLLRLSKLVLNRLKPLFYKRLIMGGSSNTDETEKRADTLLGIVSSILRIVIWTIVIMLALRLLGLDLAPIIAGAGIAGVALGFGAQELVRDFISGFFILLENQIRVGDVAVINGTGGLVEHVSLRTVVLRDLTGTVHTFQNGKINSIANMTKEWSAMVFDIGVAYKEDVDNVIDVMKKTADSLSSDPDFKQIILEPIEIFGLDAFDDSAIIIKARIRTKPAQQWVVGREYRKRLKQAFDSKGIEIPFPHRTLYWGDNTQSFFEKVLQEKQNIPK